jgi:Xaa-Pro aminopeptidase
MECHERRREQLAGQLQKEGANAFLITNPISVTYLTGFTGDSTVLIVMPDWEIVISDPRYIGQLEDECPGLETFIRSPALKLPDAIAQQLGKLSVHNVGFESSAMTVAELEGLKGLAASINWKPCPDRVEIMRTIKDEWEVKEIRQAIALAERAFSVFRALLRPDDREKDLADAMESYIRRVGGLCSCFPPIIAAGERAALPHCPPTDRPVRGSELLLVDWGVTGPRQYKSDLTRVLDARTTSTFPGPSRLEEIYTVVQRAQEAAVRAVRPGVRGQDVDRAARSVIELCGYGDQFNHGLGHGIGLEVHEAPAVRMNSETILEPGMVFTLEPGIYIPGWGGVRIEDDVLVLADGCEVLSNVPRDLAAMQAFG